MQTDTHSSTNTQGIQPNPLHASLPDRLPAHLMSYVEAQRLASMKAIRQLPEILHRESGSPENDTGYSILKELLNGTVVRREGNSCLLIGARGSGKTQLVEQCIKPLAEDLLIIRLSGWIQASDRMAMQEIAYQVSQQTASFQTSLYPNNESPPKEADELLSIVDDAPLPPVSHLPSLISLLPQIGRPVVVILDAFDLFALHPRQSLLYCLLDTAQSCRASENMHGIIVVGITNRIDTIQLLEKRVKSRFSGRTISINASERTSRWKDVIFKILTEAVKGRNPHHDWEWEVMWKTANEFFLNNSDVEKLMGELLSVTKDIRTLRKLLTSLLIQLSPHSPFLSIPHFIFAGESQQARGRFPFPSSFTYPSLCLLAASFHLDTGGQPVFTFEVLHDIILEQVRRSSSAPIQVNGGNIGMVRSTRSVLEKSFEMLVTMKIFTPVIVSSNISPAFIKYRCCLDRDEVKTIIGKSGQINLRRWLARSSEL
ncbi:origin recognition complex subunit 4 C-terminus-domain-containing protein [Cyathus striatus]|nr:origin recognition complex subunit 4 C-terminus-domain-containing protein [Cyathus striatus]